VEVPNIDFIDNGSRKFQHSLIGSGPEEANALSVVALELC
jgi:hypothetical protein